jgi:CHAT domain-containing protein/tetratricopeptide (TPR) repeat protein
MRLFCRPGFTSRLALMLALISSVTGWQPACAQATEAQPAEYMIYQYTGTSLVVKVDLPESEFEVRITGPEETLISHAGVAHRRIGAIYQYIGPTDTPRQLMISVHPLSPVDRSRISMELIQLSTRDPNVGSLADAYRLMARGIDRSHDRDTATWAMKVYALQNAARLFASLGMEEMRQWAEYFAAHLTLFELGDVQTSGEAAVWLQRSAERAGFDTVRLASLVLEGEAIARLARSLSDEQADTYRQRLHRVLTDAGMLAGRLGLDSEQARALFADGSIHEAEGEFEQAVERYQQALDIALGAGNPELANEIRGALAVAYEALGSTSGAIDVLDDITQDLAASGAADDDQQSALKMAASLAEKGRLLNAGYRFREAEVELSRAVELLRAAGGAAPWGPIALDLAWSQYSSGRWQAAAATLEGALPRTPRSGHADALARAYGSAATMARAAGQHDRAREFRALQGELLTAPAQRAGWLYERAMDTSAAQGPAAAGALRDLRSSRSTFQQSGQLHAAARSALQLCRLQAGGQGGSCPPGQIDAAYSTLTSSAMPVPSVVAMFLRAQILEEQGNPVAALGELERAVSALHFYRSELPGVLGGWYWTNRSALLRAYLDLTIRLSGTASGGGVDGAAVLLALERVRALEALDSGAYMTKAEPRESLRVLMQRLEQASPGRRDALATQVTAQVAALRSGFEAQNPRLDTASLNGLLAGMGARAGLLTYYFDGQAAYGLTASREGVRLLRLPRGTGLRESIEQLRAQIEQAPDRAPLPELGDLGARLIGPLRDSLRDTVYLLPAGPLRGFPFDALMHENAFLVEGHNVVSLHSLAALAAPPMELGPDYGRRVFLAGNPGGSGDLFRYEITSSAEIDAVRDRFIGPGLHIVQGVALREDEFGDQRFADAALLHLAMPGAVDRAVPEDSRLTLSGPAEGVGGAFISPAFVAAFDYAAELVVLSGLTVAGRDESVFDNRIGFVSDVMDHGANTVVATLWPAGDDRTADFMRRFYGYLEQERNVATALRRTRLQQLGSDRSANFRAWAGFQLHIR